MVLCRALVGALLFGGLSCHHSTSAARDAGPDMGGLDGGGGHNQDGSTIVDATPDVATIDLAADLPIDVPSVDGSYSKAVLLNRLCWGDGLATSPALAGADTSVGCGASPSPCQFPIAMDMSNCMPGPGGYCIETLAYAPPSQVNGQATCTQCQNAVGTGTALLFTVRIPPLEPNPLACPPSATSTETRVLALSVDSKAVFRVAGTDQMATILSITEVDRGLYAEWAK